ncbi:hypothetical protein [Prescottella agglutinans]|uniref:Uncharacterized protein n=1 Tax=Prescottella agglutinans TaxID=1644129 RepID=A0ABT6MJ09_9NOCA|nr:hypothetical protein [Prescottella agglutinans]MDH6284307.1 hypothetical protein [Prescottella agglutinans]
MSVEKTLTRAGYGFTALAAAYFTALILGGILVVGGAISPPSTVLVDSISWFGDTGRIALLFSLAGAASAVLAVAAFLVADRVSMTAAARTAADE